MSCFQWRNHHTVWTVMFLPFSQTLHRKPTTRITVLMISLYHNEVLGPQTPSFSEILQYFNSPGFNGPTSKFMQIERESNVLCSSKPLKGFTVLQAITSFSVYLAGKNNNILWRIQIQKKHNQASHWKKFKAYLSL